MIFPLKNLFLRLIYLLTACIKPLPKIFHVLFDGPNTWLRLVICIDVILAAARVRVRLLVPNKPHNFPRLFGDREVLGRVLQPVARGERDKISGVTLEEGGVEFVVRAEGLIVDVCDGVAVCWGGGTDGYGRHG